MIPPASELLQGLVDYLDTLPPEENKYNASAAYIIRYAEVLVRDQAARLSGKIC